VAREGRRVRVFEMDGAIPSGLSRRTAPRMSRDEERRIVASRLRIRLREIRTGLVRA
jgi:hypothetical protein